MAENLEYVQKGFRILHPMMAGYIAQEMSREYKDGWWQEVLTSLGDQGWDLPPSGDWSDLVDSLDVANCLRLLDRQWGALFRKHLARDRKKYGLSFRISGHEKRRCRACAGYDGKALR